MVGSQSFNLPYSSPSGIPPMYCSTCMYVCLIVVREQPTGLGFECQAMRNFLGRQDSSIITIFSIHNYEPGIHLFIGNMMGLYFNNVDVQNPVYRTRMKNLEDLPIRILEGPRFASP
eukprot:7463332-Ditylum_brightwellii.AAC.1